MPQPRRLVPFTLARTTSTRSQPSAAATGDTVVFSKEALAKSQEQTEQTPSEDKTEKSLWAKRYGLKAGTVVLENGHRQQTILEDSKMVRLEYSNDRLLRKETGSIQGGSVTKDIEAYDSLGGLSQRVHSEFLLSQPTFKGELTSQSSLTRTVQWFSIGMVSKELKDSMSVDANYDFMTFLNGDGLTSAENIVDVSVDLYHQNIENKYSADIIEYNSAGDIFRNTTVANGLTKESEGTTTQYHIKQTTFDADGNITYQMFLSDDKRGGEGQQQKVDMSWFENGTLKQNLHGALEIPPQTRSGKGADLPSLFKTFGTTDNQQHIKTPLDVQAQMANKDEGHTSDPATFLSATLATIATGEFDTEKNGLAETEHTTTWENTLYQNGKAVMQQTQTDSVRANPMPDKTRFIPGTGLSEDEKPTFLHDSSHSVEFYQDGQVRGLLSEHMHEFTEEDKKGITKVKTSVSTKSGTGADTAQTNAILENSIDNLDADWDAASKRMEASVQMLLGDFQALMVGLNDPGFSQSASEPPKKTL